MSCGLRLALFVLYLSAASTTICNISECRQVVDGSLDTDDETVDLREQFVVFTAENDPLQDDCEIGMTLKDNTYNSGLRYTLSVNIEMSKDVSSISCELDFTADPTYKIGSNNNSFTTTYAKDSGIALKVSATSAIAGEIWTSDYTPYRLNWSSAGLDESRISPLLQGGGNINRTVDLTKCPDFKTYICSCQKPDITQLIEPNDNKTSLECSAASIYGVTAINWTKNGNAVEASRIELKDVEGNLTMTSTLNITQDTFPADYTCTATNKYASTSKSIAVSANEDEDGDHEDGGDEDESKGEKSLLIYTIVGVVASLLVLGGTCFGLIKLATRCAEKKKRRGGRGPDTADPATTTTDPSGGGDPPVIYAQVTPRKARRQEPDEDESIYNRLDPRLMTTRRDDFRTLNHAHFTASPSTDPLIQGCYEETLVIQMEELTGAGEEKNEGRRNEGRNAEVADLY